MSSFYLTRTDFLPFIKCPHCGVGYDIEWNTEYGDPFSGTETTECAECEESFSFGAKTVYDTWK